MSGLNLRQIISEHHSRFVRLIVVICLSSCAITLLLAIQLEKVKLCDRVNSRFNDLNDVLARELILDSKETLTFELNKLKREFSLKEIHYLGSTTKVRGCSIFNFSNEQIFSVKLGESIIHKFLIIAYGPNLFSLQLVVLYIPLILLLIVIYFFLNSLSRLVTNSFIIPLDRILAQTQTGKIEDLYFSYDGNTVEFKDLEEKLNNMLDRLKIANQDNLKLAKAADLGNLASQVAHDIRSPLASLGMLSLDASDLPEDRRQILRSSINRIQDIANSLLSEYRTIKESDDLIENCLIVPIIEEIITEKRNLHRHKLNVRIEFTNDSRLFAASSNVEASLLKRVLSNIIENAIESVAVIGSVNVKIDEIFDSYLSISVSDTGVGIPENILSTLGQRKLSFGKEMGTGLGVYTSIQILKRWGGDLFFKSKVGEGTVATIKIPKSNPPSWLASQITLNDSQTVVVVDDDPTIHQVWKTRFSSLGIGVKNFSNIIEMEKFLNNTSPVNLFFLVDYELIGSPLNGLEFISQNNLYERSILVTSRYDQSDILKFAKEKKTKILPKSSVQLIPITTVDNKLVVLIDDDKLIRYAWGEEAKKFPVKFWSFSSVDDFLSAEGIPITATIYVDSDLNQGLKGELLAEQIYQRGFKNIYLATGYEDVVLPSYIIGKTSKIFPKS